jgi:hypothetical protein
MQNQGNFADENVYTVTAAAPTAPCFGFIEMYYAFIIQI